MLYFMIYYHYAINVERPFHNKFHYLLKNISECFNSLN